MKDFIAELKWRGMIHDFYPGTEDQLKKEMTTAYIGFDPTAPSLGIGNLVPIMLLKFFQLAGHKPIALIGGATVMVGDPSGKSEERRLMSIEEIRHNQERFKVQLSKFLDFDGGENAAELVNNYDWMKDFSFLEFIRDVGKHITVNYMMAKDSVKTRLEKGISFTEFTYQLLQGYDFYHLYKERGVKLQMGGSDQWGNITTGTELIRRKAGGEAYALTTPLITKADGQKFGKSEGGNVWLDPEMTSPYNFYQFWINSSDEDAGKLARIFTLRSKEEVEAIEKEHAEAPHLRKLQKAIAEEVTTRVHSKEDFEMAEKASRILFGKSDYEDLKSLDERTLLSVFDTIPKVEVPKSEYVNLENVVDLLSNACKTEIFKSKGEARRMIQGGGISVNKNKIQSIDQKVDFNLLHDKYLLVQRGKKHYYLLKIFS